jgi:hypothetical protein
MAKTRNGKGEPQVGQHAADVAPSLARPGELFTILKLKKMYDEHVLAVLSDHFDRVEPAEDPDQEPCDEETCEGPDRKRKRKRRPLDRYRVTRPLPSRVGYEALKTAYFTSTVGALVDEARLALEGLGSELRNWADNLPENLECGSKADEINEAADALEDLDWPVVPATLADLPVVYVGCVGGSRASRRDDATGALRAVVAALLASGGADESELAADLEGVADDADLVEFPGMFG